MVKDFLLGLLAIIVGVLVLLALVFGLNTAGLKFKERFGVQNANIERKIFKENKTHIEGMASDLAKYRHELSQEKDETAQQAIKDLIRSKYADFDINKLQDYSLQQFLREIRGGY